MQSSNAGRREQNDSEPERQEVRRGRRTTPRQVWKSQQENRPQKNMEDPPTGSVIKDDDTSHQEVERSQHIQESAPKTTGNGNDTEEKRKEPVMVDSQRQPGFMKYPYSTHRDAPEDDATTNTEPRFSRNVVLGTLIILAALLIGLLVVSQGHRIDELEGRIKQLESTMQIDE